MLFKYFGARWVTSSDRRPWHLESRIALGYEPSLSIVIETGGQFRILPTARNRYLHAPPTRTWVPSTRQDDER